MSVLKEIQSLVWIASFAAAIAVSAFIALPLGPIPFTMQVLVIFLAGLVLGPKKALIALLVYLLLGLVGFPIFSGGKSGIAAFLSPTGGFLMGFVPMIYIIGLGKNKKMIPAFACMLAGLTVLYICGITWFMISLKTNFLTAFYATTLPFIGFDLIKAALAWSAYKLLNKKNWINL